MTRIPALCAWHRPSVLALVLLVAAGLGLSFLTPPRPAAANG